VKRGAPVDVSGRADARAVDLSGRRLLAMRLGWVALAALVFGLDAAGVPYAYALYKSVCTRTACANEVSRITPGLLRELHDLGLSAGFFAAYNVAVLVGAVLVFATVAAVIFWRGPNDRMALFTSFTLLVFGGAAFASDIPDALAAAHPDFRLPTHVLYYFGQVCFLAFFYLFPDGRFVPRWTIWLMLLWALLFVPNAFFPSSPLNLLSGPLFFPVLVTAALAQAYRYRRVSSPAQRQQTKWVVFGGVVALLGFSAVIVLGNLIPALKHAGPVVRMVAAALIQGFIALVPVSIGVAILRSRLYDIDVVINRALVYGSLTAVLILAYAGVVVSLQYLIRTVTGQESPLAIVASTLAIAALFNPLRSRVQGFIDRRFYREKYDARRTLEAFSNRLRDETDLDGLSSHLLGVVKGTMQPEHVSLWLRESRAREVGR
jgi:hypothetical protein